MDGRLFDSGQESFFCPKLNISYSMQSPWKHECSIICIRLFVLVINFSFQHLLDKPWSQVGVVLPPPPVVAFIFIAHMVQIPLTVRRFASNVNVCRGERILPEIIDDLDRVCSPL